jgi:hypothetical protein
MTDDKIYVAPQTVDDILARMKEHFPNDPTWADPVAARKIAQDWAEDTVRAENREAERFETFIACLRQILGVLSVEQQGQVLSDLCWLTGFTDWERIKAALESPPTARQ